MTTQEHRDSSDPFTTAYRMGTARMTGTPGIPVADAGLAMTAAGGVAAPRVRAATVATFALGGQIVTSTGAIRGWLVVEGDLIGDVTTREPAGIPALATDGVITPGLIDLHGHPEFNVFAPWEPPRLFPNRYSWRDSDAYRQLVREPQNQLLTTLPPGTQLRYAEIRALVGGVTAIQGAGQAAQGQVESLVRNVDGVIFGERHARSVIDLPSSLDGFGGDSLAADLAGIRSGEVTALYVHLGEGQRDNQRSIDEFDDLVRLGALTEATIIIHGTAMTRDQLGQAAAADAKLVWSPQSNLRLYGETTSIADALEVGLPVGLGADWLPSGSLSLLAEMKVARQQLAIQGRPIQAADLVAMVTSGAAEIAGLGDRLGAIQVGRPADIAVFARRAADPYESVCAAAPDDVELVLIGGDPTYGRADWIPELLAEPQNPILESILAWGRPMLLDTSYESVPNEDPTPRLAQLRAELIAGYPQVGPIWA